MGDEDPGGVGRAAGLPDDDRFAAKLRGFGSAGILAIAVTTLVGPIFEPGGRNPGPPPARRSRTSRST
jgi:hypothetical protein